MATEEDEKMADSWKADADGILIFVRLSFISASNRLKSSQSGLFSAAIASLIPVSIQDIRPNAQDTSNFYLANIYQAIADPNQANISLPSSPPPFSPPNYAIWVNALWFLSLVISLTCALLATLLRQWVRKYLKVTQSRYAPHKRARIRAFLAEGVEKLLLPWTVETLPTLLHISLFLFFAGLVVFLWNVDITIFKLVLSWVGICTALYGCITVTPLFRHDSPYHTPLTLPVWHIVTGLRFLTYRALQRLARFDYLSHETYVRFRSLAGSHGKRLVQGMQKTVEEAALNSPSEIDTRAFLWTLDCLDEDHELEHFFSGIPGFRSSNVVKDPFPTLAEEGKQRVFAAMNGLLDRTFSSDLLPEVVKKRRAIVCTKAVDPAHTPEAFSVLNTILSKYRSSDPLVAEIVQIVRGWDIHNENGISLAKATFIKTVARLQPHKDSWVILASKSLGVPEAVLRDYAAHGDSLSLAVLIHVVRLQFSHFWTRSWTFDEFSGVLLAGSKLSAQDTLPELQHDFCVLWNQIVRKVRDENDRLTALYTLGPIRDVYTALHLDTNSAPSRIFASTTDPEGILRVPSSYPLCNVPGHHPDSTNDAHGDPTSTAFVTAILHDHGNTAHVPSLLSGSPYTPSSSAHPLRVDESLSVAPPRNHNIASPIYLRLINRITTGSRRTPPTLPNPVTTGAIHGSIDTIRLFTPDPSASAPPPKSRASASPPDAVNVEHNADGGAPYPEVPSSPPTQVLATGPPLTSDSPVTETDHACSSLDSHLPMPARGSPSPSYPRLLSDLGAATEGGGSAKTTMHKEKGAPYPSLGIRKDGIAGPDLPIQSLQLPPSIDIAIAGHSYRPLDTEDTVDNPPHPSHGQFFDRV